MQQNQRDGEAGLIMQNISTEVRSLCLLVMRFEYENMAEEECR